MTALGLGGPQATLSTMYLAQAAAIITSAVLQPLPTQVDRRVVVLPVAYPWLPVAAYLRYISNLSRVQFRRWCEENICYVRRGYWEQFAYAWLDEYISQVRGSRPTRIHTNSQANSSTPQTRLGAMYSVLLGHLLTVLSSMSASVSAVTQLPCTGAGSGDQIRTRRGTI